MPSAPGLLRKQKKKQRKGEETWRIKVMYDEAASATKAIKKLARLLIIRSLQNNFT